MVTCRRVCVDSAGCAAGGPSARSLALAAPVTAVHDISHDPTLSHKVELADGRSVTALELQGEYLELAKAFVAREGSDEQTDDILRRWESVLDRLEDDPMSCVRDVDWVTKLQILEGYRTRDGLDWDSHTLQLVDLQYHDIRLHKGLYHQLVRTGRMDRLFSEEQIAAAVSDPPRDTRAYFRGMCLAKFSKDIAAASWDSVIFDLPGHDSLQRIPTMEPLRGTAEHVGGLFESSATASDLFSAITGR